MLSDGTLSDPPWVVEIDGVKFATPEPVVLLLKEVSEERDALEAQLADYELLKSAVDENSGECLPDCDSYGHAEGCEYVSMSATMIIQQKQLAALRDVARLARYFINGNWDFEDGSDAYDRHEMLIDALDAWEALDA